MPDLEPGQTSSLGPALARLMETLQLETGAEAVYLYVFDHSHLHFHLAPHQTGDALSKQIIKGSEVTAGGRVAVGHQRRIPAASPGGTHLQTASRVRERLTMQTAS